jgi:hypothetical protein
MREASGLPDFVGLLRWDTRQDGNAASDLPGSGPVTAAVPLAGGSRNHRFLLSRGDALMVLRRPPPHPRRDRPLLHRAGRP